MIDGGWRRGQNVGIVVEVVEGEVEDERDPVQPWLCMASIAPSVLAPLSSGSTFHFPPQNPLFPLKEAGARLILGIVDVDIKMNCLDN